MNGWNTLPTHFLLASLGATGPTGTVTAFERTPCIKRPVLPLSDIAIQVKAATSTQETGQSPPAGPAACAHVMFWPREIIRCVGHSHCGGQLVAQISEIWPEISVSNQFSAFHGKDIPYTKDISVI